MNRRPPDYESGALPLSYCGGVRRPAYALGRTRTATPFGTTPSRWRVYQFHHQRSVLLFLRFRRVTARDVEDAATRTGQPTGPTGLEPATSRVTVECSNQTELLPLARIGGSRGAPTPPPNPISLHLHHRVSPRSTSPPHHHHLTTSHPLAHRSSPYDIARRGIEPLSAP